jgi:hypothetical protein
MPALTGKEQKAKSKASRRKEIIIGVEISEMESNREK